MTIKIFGLLLPNLLSQFSKTSCILLFNLLKSFCKFMIAFFGKTFHKIILHERASVMNFLFYKSSTIFTFCIVFH